MTDQHYRIYGLMKNPADAPTDWTTIPSHINYKTQVRRMHYDEDMVSGQLMRREYLRDYNPETDSFEIPILAAFFGWERDPDQNNRLIRRTSYRRWYRMDGTLGPAVYDEPKIYRTLQESNRADTRRRQNIILNLESQTEDFGVLPFVQTMFRSLAPEMRSYEHLYDPKLIEKIMTYSGVWLDTDVSVEPIVSMIPVPIPAGTRLRDLLAMTLDYDRKVIGA